MANKKALKSLCTGAIHTVLYRAKFMGYGSPIDVMCVGLSRKFPQHLDGFAGALSGALAGEAQFATVYVHPCGKVATHIDAGHCLTLETMNQYVVPLMHKLEDYAASGGDILSRAGMAAALGISGTIGCSEGGCKVCKDVPAAVIEMLKSIAKVSVKPKKAKAPRK